MSKRILLGGKKGGKKTARRGANQRQRLEHRKVRRENLFRGGVGLKRAAILLLVVGLLGAAGYGIREGFQAYRDGRILTVNRIEVSGNHHWDSSRLIQLAGLEVGSGVPGVSLRTARESLRHLPGIQDVILHCSLNGDLRMEVKEEPVLGIRQLNPSHRWQGLTASGAWMPLSEAEGDVPVIDIQRRATTEDLAALAAFLDRARSQYAPLYAGFSQIALRGPDEAEVYWRDGDFRVRLDYTNKPLNSLEFLKTLLAREQASWRSGSTVDMRVEGFAYVL